MADVRPYTSAIILAGGAGTRFLGDKTKQKYEIAGVSVLKRTLLAFDKCDIIDEIVLVCRADEWDFARECALGLSKRIIVTEGGLCRAESARRGFESVSRKDGIVMIHDAARCLITDKDICAVANACYTSGAASAAHTVTDTVKRVSGGAICATVDRTELVTVATPQAFSYEIYERALESKDSAEITDDNMRVERLGVGITPVYTSKENIKITTNEDIALAEFILKAREGRADS